MACIPGRVFYKKKPELITVIPKNNVDSEQESTEDELENGEANTSYMKKNKKKVLVPVNEIGESDTDNDDSDDTSRWPRPGVQTDNLVIPATDDEDEDRDLKPRRKRISKAILTDRYSQKATSSGQSSGARASRGCSRRLILSPSVIDKQKYVYSPSARSQKLVNAVSKTVSETKVLQNPTPVKSQDMNANYVDKRKILGASNHGQKLGRIPLPVAGSQKLVNAVSKTVSETKVLQNPTPVRSQDMNANYVDKRKILGSSNHGQKLGRIPLPVSKASKCAFSPSSRNKENSGVIDEISQRDTDKVFFSSPVNDDVSMLSLPLSPILCNISQDIPSLDLKSTCGEQTESANECDMDGLSVHELGDSCSVPVGNTDQAGYCANDMHSLICDHKAKATREPPGFNPNDQKLTAQSDKSLQGERSRPQAQGKNNGKHQNLRVLRTRNTRGSTLLDCLSPSCTFDATKMSPNSNQLAQQNASVSKHDQTYKVRVTKQPLAETLANSSSPKQDDLISNELQHDLPFLIQCPEQLPSETPAKSNSPGGDKLSKSSKGEQESNKDKASSPSKLLTESTVLNILRPKTCNAIPFQESEDVLALAIKSLRKNCFVCQSTGEPTAQSAHKCDTCGLPVHGLDGSCSVSVGTTSQEGYGCKDRRCLICDQKANAAKVTPNLNPNVQKLSSKSDKLHQRKGSSPKEQQENTVNENLRVLRTRNPRVSTLLDCLSGPCSSDGNKTSANSNQLPSQTASISKQFPKIKAQVTNQLPPKTHAISNLPEQDDPDDPSPIDLQDDPHAESSAEDTSLPLQQRLYLMRNPDEKWTEGDICEKLPAEGKSFTAPESIKTPREYFQMFFDEEVLRYISDQSNLYCVQKNAKSTNITLEELNGFISIMVYMGICRLPAIEDYWKQETRVARVADVMSYRRFQYIRSHIHFSDNEGDPTDDRLRKIRPLLDMMRRRCQNLENETKQSVDECMVRYKGTKAGNLRQYQPDKPSSKWGFKLFVRAGSSGITYDFIPYCGSGTFASENLTKEEMKLGVGAMSVISLCKSIPCPDATTVTFDNFYSGVPLVTYLKRKMNINSLGTIRKDRLDSCTFPSDKELKDLGRGACFSKVNKNNLVMVRWQDNKAVTLISSFVGVEPKGELLRYDKNAKAKIPVQCPRAIQVYNSTMGGVDLSDMFMALYQIPCRARRWYLPLFGYTLDMTLTNAWLLYKRDCELLGVTQDIPTSKDFRLAVAASLCVGTQRTRGRPSLNNSLTKKKVKKTFAPRPCNELRLDELNHLPAVVDRGRCRYCQSLANIKCTKCDCRLCLNSHRNCFTQFHLQKNIDQP